MIQSIFVRAMTKKTCAYSLNDSTDTHSMSYDEMADFLASRVSAEVFLRVRDFLDKKEAFLIDLTNNVFHELFIDYSILEETEKQKMGKEVVKMKLAVNNKPKENDVYVLAKNGNDLIRKSILSMGKN